MYHSSLATFALLVLNSVPCIASPVPAISLPSSEHPSSTPEVSHANATLESPATLSPSPWISRSHYVPLLSRDSLQDDSWPSCLNYQWRSQPECACVKSKIGKLPPKHACFNSVGWKILPAQLICCPDYPQTSLPPGTSSSQSDEGPPLPDPKCDTDDFWRLKPECQCFERKIKPSLKRSSVTESVSSWLSSRTAALWTRREQEPDHHKKKPKPEPQQICGPITSPDNGNKIVAAMCCPTHPHWTGPGGLSAAKFVSNSTLNSTVTSVRAAAASPLSPSPVELQTREELPQYTCYKAQKRDVPSRLAEEGCRLIRLPGQDADMKCCPEHPKRHSSSSSSSKLVSASALDLNATSKDLAEVESEPLNTLSLLSPSHPESKRDTPDYTCHQVHRMDIPELQIEGCDFGHVDKTHYVMCCDRDVPNAPFAKAVSKFESIGAPPLLSPSRPESTRGTLNSMCLQVPQNHIPELQIEGCDFGHVNETHRVVCCNRHASFAKVVSEFESIGALTRLSPKGSESKRDDILGFTCTEVHEEHVPDYDVDGCSFGHGEGTHQWVMCCDLLSLSPAKTMPPSPPPSPTPSSRTSFPHPEWKRQESGWMCHVIDQSYIPQHGIKGCKFGQVQDKTHHWVICCDPLAIPPAVLLPPPPLPPLPLPPLPSGMSFAKVASVPAPAPVSSDSDSNSTSVNPVASSSPSPSPSPSLSVLPIGHALSPRGPRLCSDEQLVNTPECACDLRYVKPGLQIPDDFTCEFTFRGFHEDTFTGYVKCCPTHQHMAAPPDIGPITGPSILISRQVEGNLTTSTGPHSTTTTTTTALTSPASSSPSPLALQSRQGRMQPDLRPLCPKPLWKDSPGCQCNIRMIKPGLKIKPDTECFAGYSDDRTYTGEIKCCPLHKQGPPHHGGVVAASAKFVSVSNWNSTANSTFMDTAWMSI